MIYQLIPLLALAFHFLLVFTSSVNTTRKPYTLISLVIVILSSMTIYGFVLENIILAAASIIVGLISYQEQDATTDVVIRSLFSLSLVILGATQFLSMHLNLLLVSLVFISLKIAKGTGFKLSHYIFYIVSLLCAQFYLLVDFSAIQWLNPSFILAETIVASEIYYLDYASDLRLAVLLTLLLGLVFDQDSRESSINHFAIGCLLIVLSTDATMIQQSYFSMISSLLVGIAFLRDLQNLQAKKETLFSTTLMCSSTIFFMSLMSDGPLEIVALVTFLYLLLASVTERFFAEKRLAHSSFVFAKNLLLFLFFSYLSLHSSMKIFAVISAGVCLLGVLRSIQGLVDIWDKEEAVR